MEHLFKGYAITKIEYEIINVDIYPGEYELKE